MLITRVLVARYRLLVKKKEIFLEGIIMKRNYQNQGFTIVELLTVMSVIAILIGLLVPALSKVRAYAAGVKQRAQFHSISVALEMFKNDEGDYPPSEEIPMGGTYIEGAQRLAEALVGRDYQGFDTASKWHPILDLQPPVTNAYATVDPEKTDSLNRRKGPYLKLENIGAFNIDQLYPGFTTLIYGDTPNKQLAPLLTDVFVDRVLLPSHF